MLDSLSVSLAGLASLASLASWRRPLPGMASPPNHASSSLKVEEGCWGLRSLGRHFLGIEHILGFGGPSTNLLLALVGYLECRRERLPEPLGAPLFLRFAKSVACFASSRFCLI